LEEYEKLHPTFPLQPLFSDVRLDPESGVYVLFLQPLEQVDFMETNFPIMNKRACIQEPLNFLKSLPRRTADRMRGIDKQHDDSQCMTASSTSSEDLILSDNDEHEVLFEIETLFNTVFDVNKENKFVDPKVVDTVTTDIEVTCSSENVNDTDSIAHHRVREGSFTAWMSKGSSKEEVWCFLTDDFVFDSSFFEMMV
jgi:hypothetical protein